MQFVVAPGQPPGGEPSMTRSSENDRSRTPIILNARAMDRTIMLCAAKIICLFVETGGYSIHRDSELSDPPTGPLLLKGA